MALRSATHNSHIWRWITSRTGRGRLLFLASFLGGVLGCGDTLFAVERATAQSAEHAGDFGNIWIERIRENNSYRLHLFQTPRMNSAGFMDIQCFLGDPRISITLGHPDVLKKMLGPQIVTLWSEKGDPRDVLFYGHSSGAFAIAIGQRDRADELDRTIDGVLTTIEHAERFLAFSIGGRTATMDAMHLPAAHARFAQLCASTQMPPN